MTTSNTSDDLDLSFLDAYRRGPSPASAPAPAPAAQTAPPPAAGVPALPDVTAQTAVAETAPPPVAGVQAPPEPRAPALVHSDAFDADAADVARDERGRSGGSDVRASASTQPAAGAGLEPPAAGQEQPPERVDMSTAGDATPPPAAAPSRARQKPSAPPLPHTGFQLAGAASQPVVRSFPESVLTALREQLRTAALRLAGLDHQTARRAELPAAIGAGANSDAAQEYSQRLSQPALVVAFLVAQLDLGLEHDLDPATRTAVRLFRSVDPLLGSIVDRLDALEHRDREQSDALQRLRTELRAVAATSATIEHGVAYSIADRTQNFLRGGHDIHDAPITHTDALFVRDRVRAQTAEQMRRERDQDGRPYR